MFGIPSLSIFSKASRKENKEPVVQSTRRKVITVTKDGNLVGRYNDVDTVCKILKLNKDAVLMCLKGAQKIHKGYVIKEEEI